MARKTLPQKGIIYTFRFRTEKGTNYVKLIYEGINSKGRLEFYNYNSKAYTSMPEKRFSYIHRFNLVKEEKVNVEIKPVPLKHIVDDTIMNKQEISAYENKLLNTLRTLSDLQREKAGSIIGRKFELFMEDLETCLSKSENEVDSSFYGKTMSEVIKIQSALFFTNIVNS